GCGKVLHVSLHVHLTLLPVGRRRKSDNAIYTRADALRDGLDHSTFSGAIPAFQDENHAETFFFDPILESAELHLELAKLLQVLLVAHPRFAVVFCFLVLLHRYCLRKRHALIENRITANADRITRFGHNALQGASFNVTPRTIVTRYRSGSKYDSF